MLMASEYMHELSLHEIMSHRGMKLALEVGQPLPINRCWRINDGYLKVMGWADQTAMFTLGIWGPGEMVMPGLIAKYPVELQALSLARVQEWNPDPVEQHSCSMAYIQQLVMLLRVTRIRPAEMRIFHLLIWLSDRFGVSTEHGYSLPVGAMNLTHRQLAEMASVSRVTVTKSLAHFRQQGWLYRSDDVEILTETGLSLFRRLN